MRKRFCTAVAVAVLTACVAPTKQVNVTPVAPTAEVADTALQTTLQPGFVHYATVNRPNDATAALPGQTLATVRDLFVDPAGLAAMQTNGTLPERVIFGMNTYRAKLNRNGVPALDANGRFVRGDLIAFESMSRTPRSDVTSRVWQPALLDPRTGRALPVDLADCTNCHRAASEGSVYSIGELKRYAATGKLQFASCERPNRLPCR
jgi:hypothetical protein